MTPDQSLADLSDTFFAVSVAVYSVALVAFCAQLAFGRRPVSSAKDVALSPPPRVSEPTASTVPPPSGSVPTRAKKRSRRSRSSASRPVSSAIAAASTHT